MILIRLLVFLFVVLTANAAHAVVAFDAAANGPETGACDPCTWNHTVSGTNTFLWVVISVQDTACQNATVTYDSVSMTEYYQYSPTANRCVNIFYLVGANTGTNEISVDLDASDGVVAGSVSLTGVDQASPLGTPQTHEGIGTSCSPASITIPTDGMGIDGGFHAQAEAVTPTYDERLDRGLDEHRVHSQTFATSGSADFDWSWTTSDFFGCRAVAVNPAATNDWTSVGTLGSVNSETADQSSLALTTTAACEAANTCVCAGAVDNFQTTDGNPNAITMSDSGSNSWTDVEFVNGQGTAQTGALAWLAWTKPTTTIASAGTITATFTNNTSRDAAALTCWEFSNSISGYTISSDSATLATDALDPGAITISALSNVERLWIHALAGEGPNSDAYTWDLDYTQFDPNGTTPSGGATQFARPTSDIDAGVWTTTPLWSDIDDGASPDSVVILSDASPASTEPFSVQTSDPTDPALSTGHIIRANWAKNTSAGANYIGTCELRQGMASEASLGTLIATLNSPAISTTTLQTDTYTLSAGEADSITNYTDLQLRCWAAKSGGGANKDFKIEFIELEVPGAGGPTDGMHVRGGFRIFTGTTDTVDVTSTTADRDYAQVLAALLANAPAGGGCVGSRLAMMGVGC